MRCAVSEKVSCLGKNFVANVPGNHRNIPPHFPFLLRVSKAPEITRREEVKKK